LSWANWAKKKQKRFASQETGLDRLQTKTIVVNLCPFCPE